MRRVGLATFGIVSFAVLGILSAVDRMASAHLRSVAPQRRREWQLLSVTQDTVTVPRNADTARQGQYGIAWDGRTATVGEIVAIDETTVTRRLLGTTQLPTVGSAVSWIKGAYRGDPRSTHGLVFENVCIPGPLGPLPAWLVPGPRRTWVLLVHGFRATREEALRILPTLARLGVPALVTTYRNDAGAPPSPDGLYHLGDTEWQDVAAGVTYALEHGAEGVVLFGWSMGGCLVETFMQRSPEAKRVRAVILDSPIVSYRWVIAAEARRRRLPGWSVPLLAMVIERRAGANLATLARGCPQSTVAPPTLLMHGTNDGLVPVASSDSFARDHAPHVTYYRLEGADHTLLWNANPPTYERMVAAFLEEAVGVWAN